MNSVSFEDAIFIVNMRIRLIRDTLHLNPPPELFLEKCLDDLAFINWVLDFLTQLLIEKGELFSSNNEFAYASDAEWQFNQLITEFSAESSPFSSAIYPETCEKIVLLRKASDARRKALEETSLSEDIAKSEPVVSSAELNGLLGSA